VSDLASAHAGGSAIVHLAERSGRNCSLNWFIAASRVRTVRAVKRAFESVWREPAPKGRPPVGTRDKLLGAAVVAVVVVELLVRSDIVWRPAVAVFGLGLAAAVVWRRSWALTGVVFGFGGFALLDVATRVADAGPVVLYAGAVVLVLTYSLFRWGSGRDALIGLVVMGVSTAVIVAINFTGTDDAIGGPVVLLFVAAIGGAIRFRTAARAELIGRVKLQEREQLARELHDTVAHHVSAIAIQAQAGLFMAKSSSLAGAIESLEVIESEAARTLDEMRVMVGALRDREHQPELTPIRGLGDIERLTLRSAGGTTVGVQLVGNLDHLLPAVEAALYRVAQESVTNALRHARNPTRVDVSLVGTTNDVTLTIEDDGAPSIAKPNLSGFGLVGMTERVTVLDGTLAAGPTPERGWSVHAVLPRTASTA
jgi:signal transduction histidine kinase